MTPITKPCAILGMPAATYHADPCPEPALSASLARELLMRSPLHAACKHPRIARRPRADNKAAFDIGTAAHAWLLYDEREFAIIDADDWRTKAAKEAREEAYATGKTPLLAYQADEVRYMVECARAQLADHESSAAWGRGRGRASPWRESTG